LVADVAFDLVAIVFETFLEAIEGIGEGGLGAFAGGTIAGDEFLITETMLFWRIFWFVVGIMDFTKFMTNIL
jgi:hypothetical protein